jgi:Fe-S-cluster containining protein
MVCRENCGACCIVPSISSIIPGMPKGKPAGVQCIHLTDKLTCRIYDSPHRPKVCDGFQADPLVCGNCREEAMKIFAELEGIVLSES